MSDLEARAVSDFIDERSELFEQVVKDGRQIRVNDIVSIPDKPDQIPLRIGDRFPLWEGSAPEVGRLISAPRPPKAVYKGTNGFVDPVRARMVNSGNVKTNLHAIVSSLDTASSVDKRELGDGVERHAFMERVLELKGSFFPSLQEIQLSNQEAETSKSVAARRAELKQAHEAQIDQLFALQAQDYHNDALERRFAKDDSTNVPDINEFYKMTRQRYSNLGAFIDDELASYRESYLETDLELLKLQKKLQSQEEIERRRQDAQFPGSIAAYRSLRSKDAQIRVARYLTETDQNVRERMLSEFGWAWRQTSALQGEFDSNPEFQTEMRERLKEIEVRDPRKRPTT